MKRNEVFEVLTGLILGYAGIMIIVWCADIWKWGHNRTWRWI